MSGIDEAFQRKVQEAASRMRRGIGTKEDAEIIDQFFRQMKSRNSVSLDRQHG